MAIALHKLSIENQPIFQSELRNAGLLDPNSIRCRTTGGVAHPQSVCRRMPNVNRGTLEQRFDHFRNSQQYITRAVPLAKDIIKIYTQWQSVIHPGGSGMRSIAGGGPVRRPQTATLEYLNVD
jgi:hypothetical protein